MLKIDCEGCEWHDLAPWLDNVLTTRISITFEHDSPLSRASLACFHQVCTGQLLIEMHITPKTIGSGEMVRLLRRLAHEFTLFHGEPNLRCGWRSSTTRACVELSWIRREPCGAEVIPASAIA